MRASRIRNEDFVDLDVLLSFRLKPVVNQSQTSSGQAFYRGRAPRSTGQMTQETQQQPAQKSIVAGA
jgi:hypothetical protein